MVSKSKKPSTGSKKGRVKVGKLELNKETVKDLTSGEKKGVKGGSVVLTCPQCGASAGCQNTAGNRRSCVAVCGQTIDKKKI